jgi:hypothetical protein
MGVSKVELANMALDALGVDRIASLTEASSAARIINSRIDQAIEAVLEMSDWTFARRIISLASVTNDWTQRYANKFDIPNDVIKVIRLVPLIDLPNEPPIPYSLANGALYTDENEVWLWYTYRDTNTTKWPMAFIEAVSFYLARAIAMPLTRKRQMVTDMNALFMQQVGMAIEYDAAQEATFWSYPSEYLTARGSLARNQDGRGADGSSYWD